MEDRLRPANAIIGLTTENDVNRAVLREAGFRLVGLEVPVATRHGNVVVDLVLYHPETALLVACEAKSGRTIKDGQATRYASLNPADLVQASHITLAQRLQPQVVVTYVCLAEHVGTVRDGLDTISVGFPVIGVSDRKIIFDLKDEQPEPLNSVLITRQLELVAPFPRIIAFDQESPVEIIEPYVKAQLVTALSRRREQVTLHTLAEQMAPHFALYGARARRQLVKKVGLAASKIAAADSATFEYVSPRPNDDGLVRLLRTPEDNDPRGRTQAYQALARSGRQGRRRAPRMDPNQLDLLREVEQGDDEGIDEAADGEETS